MALRKFSARLRSRGIEETHVRNLRFNSLSNSQASKDQYTHIEEVPYHVGKPETIDAAADAYLQIWEFDNYTGNRYLNNEETDPDDRINRCIAKIPGVMVLDGNKWIFAKNGDARLEHTFDERHGALRLAMHNVGEADEVELEIPFGEYEGVCELVAAVVANADSTVCGNNNLIVPRHTLHNVHATVLDQIEVYGGVCAFFVADYDFDNAANNEKEFRRQANSMIATHPPLLVDNGRIIFGMTEISDKAEVAPVLATLRATLQSAHGLSTSPQIAHLAFFAHGIRRAIHIAASFTGPGSLQRNNAHDFVQTIKDHVTDNVVVPLMSCSAARGGGNKRSGKALRTKGEAVALYGQPYPAEILGEGSLCWTLHRELYKAGKEHATVWGHSIPAPATRNRYLRVFCQLGSADFLPLNHGKRRVTKASRTTYLQETAKKPLSGDRDKFVTHTHRRNLIRAVHLLSYQYLQWTWKIGHELSPSTPGYHAEAKRRADVILDELRPHMGSGDADTEVLDYATRDRYVTGIRAPATDIQLTENFAYSELAGLRDGLPFPLELAGYLQVLRYRSLVGIRIVSVVRQLVLGIVGLKLRPAPDRDDKRADLLAAAQAMVADELYFTAATLQPDGSIDVEHVITPRDLEGPQFWPAGPMP